MNHRRSRFRIQAVVLALLLPLLTAMLSKRFLLGSEQRWTEAQQELSRIRASQDEIQAQLEQLRQMPKAPPTSIDARWNQPTQTSDSASGEALRHFWRTPPATLPAWEPESPYVWMEKSALKQLPLVALTSGGHISPEFAEILGMNSNQIARIESALENILQRHFSNELAHAKVQIQPASTPLAEGAPAASEGSLVQEVRSIEVVIPALGTEASELLQNFESTVEQELGAQRRQLLFASAQSWLDEEFSYRGENEKRYTVTRLPGEMFEVGSVRGPISLWHSVRQLELAVPPHLLELFRPMLTKPKGH